MKTKLTKKDAKPISHQITDYVFRLKSDESGGYSASVLEFPGCFAEGDTAEEAIKNLESSAESWVAAAIESGYTVRSPIDFDGCSGKTVVRMPRSLHKQAVELAELEGCSLNQLLVTAIAHYVGGKQLVSELKNITNHIYLTGC
ncbi:toxin-antitoxin system HicB family antitoxin [Methylococcaceae bacterium WWC4]|nr:toxin-antitoxin system HicB family antitoxin [Methylococcaceae bacterium WWC4]